MTNGSLMKVNSIAECYNTFDVNLALGVLAIRIINFNYSETCVKQSLSKKTENWL